MSAYQGRSRQSIRTPRDLWDALCDACRELGVVPKAVLADGRWHPANIEGDPRGRGDARILLFPDGEGGIVYNWKTGEYAPFFVGSFHSLSDEERRERERQRREAIRGIEEQRRKERERAILKARSDWQSASPADNSHPYLRRKEVPAYGLRIDDKGNLLVPLKNTDGDLQCVQRITPNGDKWFPQDGSVTGHFHLIGNPDAANIICIAEGYATAATIHLATKFPVAVAFNAGNLKPVAVNIRQLYPGKRIVIAGDHDDFQTCNHYDCRKSVRVSEGPRCSHCNRDHGKVNTGKVKARTAAEAISAVWCVPDFTGLDISSEPTDFNDLHRLAGIGAVRQQIEKAIAENEESSGSSVGRASKSAVTEPSGLKDEDKEALLQHARQVLFDKPADLPEYPINALGPLAPVTQAIAEQAQLDIAMAGQSVLAVAALCAQAYANVETLNGIKPLSLYLLTIGQSGDGKTTAEEAALAIVRKYEREQSRCYCLAMENYELTKSERKQGEPPPERPRSPYILTADATIEGLRRNFSDGRPSQGMFTSEGAIVLSGYGMKEEHKKKTAAAFNQLWDRGEISVSRGTNGRLQLYDRRFSVHLMIQPDAAREVLMDDVLTEIGFWPRFLLAWPEPSKPRKARPFNLWEIPEIGRFWQRCTELLPATDREECTDLPTLTITDDGRQRLGTFFEAMEKEAKLNNGRYHGHCRAYALRAAEQACRIAGVLAVYAGEHTIDENLMLSGIKLALYSVETWRSVFHERDEKENTDLAFRLLRWMVEKCDGIVAEKDILRLGPASLRSASRRDAALARLRQVGLAYVDQYLKPTTWIVAKPPPK